MLGLLELSFILNLQYCYHGLKKVVFVKQKPLFSLLFRIFHLIKFSYM